MGQKDMDIAIFLRLRSIGKYWYHLLRAPAVSFGNFLSIMVIYRVRVLADVGIASAVGLYFVGTVAFFSTVTILKYGRVPKEEEPDFSWKPRPLDVVDHHDSQPWSSSRKHSSIEQDAISGLFGKHVGTGYDPQENAFVDQDIIESYSKGPHTIILKEVIDPWFEQYLQNSMYWVNLNSTGNPKFWLEKNTKSSHIISREANKIIQLSLEILVFSSEFLRG